MNLLIGSDYYDIIFLQINLQIVLTPLQMKSRNYFLLNGRIPNSALRKPNHFMRKFFKAALMDDFFPVKHVREFKKSSWKNYYQSFSSQYFFVCLSKKKKKKQALINKQNTFKRSWLTSFCDFGSFPALTMYVVYINSLKLPRPSYILAKG